MSNVPSGIAEIYDPLSKEVTWLHGRWICYRQLFGHSEARVDLLNESAATFFFVIQDILLGDVQLGLSKLTDPARTAGKENLSLYLLQERLEHHGDQVLAARARGKLEALKDKCWLFREWRNKKLAHLDLVTTMKAIQNPIPGISREMVEQALEDLRSLLNAIELHYNDHQIAYELFVMDADGEALIASLKCGLRYRELLKKGTIPFSDLHEGGWHDA
jgi:hypothetical protein